MLLGDRRDLPANIEKDFAQLVVTLTLQKRYYEASFILEKQQDSIVKLFNQGICLYYLEQYKDSLEVFKKALTLLNSQLPIHTNAMAKEAVELQLQHKQIDEMESVCMQAISEEYLQLFGDMTKLYLLCNLLLCMEKLQMWSDITQLATTVNTKYKISYVQALLEKTTKQ